MKSEVLSLLVLALVLSAGFLIGMSVELHLRLLTDSVGYCAVNSERVKKAEEGEDLFYEQSKRCKQELAEAQQRCDKTSR